MQRRPDILLILCDELRPFELGCYGHPVVRTPNIDRLAAGGVRFEVCASNNPLCTPARACLLSWQYSRTCTGMLSNVDEPVVERIHFPDATLPELLRAAGCDTALVGKWHLGPRPELLGFDRVVYPKVSHLNTDQTFYDQARRLVDERYRFFDLRSDPYELNNLANTLQQAELAAILRQRVLEWDRETPWMPGTLGGPFGRGPEK